MKFVLLLTCSFIFFLGYQPVFAQDLLADIQKQNQALAGEKGANLKEVDPRLLTAQIIKVFLTVVGTMFTAWTFFGGYLIFTSAGDSDKITRAKSIITTGAIGIMVVLSSYGIAKFFTVMWGKSQEDPYQEKADFYVKPDSDFYNKDPLQQNTAIPN